MQLLQIQIQKKLFIFQANQIFILSKSRGFSKKYLIGETRKIRSYSIHYLSKKYFKPDLLRMDVEGKASMSVR